MKSVFLAVQNHSILNIHVSLMYAMLFKTPFKHIQMYSLKSSILENFYLQTYIKHGFSGGGGGG